MTLKYYKIKFSNKIILKLSLSYLQVKINSGLQKWNITTGECSDCYITLEYNSTTLILQATLHQSIPNNTAFFFRLYLADNDTQCQWLEIYRENIIEESLQANLQV